MIISIGAIKNFSTPPHMIFIIFGLQFCD